VNSDAAVLRVAFLPQGGALVRLASVVAGAGLVAGAAQITIPFEPVPLTGQTFAVLLVGASLGALDGAASLALYLLVGLAGAPIYADGSGGLEIVTGVTGGYLIGFVAAALLTGALAQRRWDRRFSSAVAAMLCGNVVIYLAGLPWLAAEIDAGLEPTLEAGLYPFIVGDLLKLYLAAALLPAVWRIVGRT
jgi:biotin transport system substrate-specific component